MPACMYSGKDLVIGRDFTAERDFARDWIDKHVEGANNKAYLCSTSTRVVRSRLPVVIPCNLYSSKHGTPYSEYRAVVGVVPGTR